MQMSYRENTTSLSNGGAHFEKFHVFVQRLERMLEAAGGRRQGVAAIAAKAIGIPADIIIHAVESQAGPAEAIGGLSDGTIVLAFIGGFDNGQPSRQQSDRAFCKKIEDVLGCYGVRRGGTKIRIVQRTVADLGNGTDLIADLTGAPTNP